MRHNTFYFNLYVCSMCIYKYIYIFFNSSIKLFQKLLLLLLLRK